MTMPSDFALTQGATIARLDGSTVTAWGGRTLAGTRLTILLKGRPPASPLPPHPAHFSIAALRNDLHSEHS